MPKKPFTKQQKREQRKRKAAQWLMTYNGSHVVKAYRKKFNVGIECALRELEELGYAFTDQEKHNLCNGHDALLEQKQREKDRALLELAGDIMLHESTDLDFCESEEEILTVLRESGVTAPPKKKPKQGLPKNWKGHYCKMCQRYLANERFSGKGHKTHICKACASRLKAERKAVNKERQQNKTE
ncbi:MAG: hypothetical protein ACOX8Q_02190 [Christensenellales bacterium]|jgi:hypothetical protein